MIIHLRIILSQVILMNGLKLPMEVMKLKNLVQKKKDKIGIFVRADKVSNLSFLMIDLSDMRFYWADMYIGKAEIE